MWFDVGRQQQPGGPRGGFSGAFHSHTQEVAFIMHGFTIGIDLASFKINRLVADRTIYLGLT